MTPQDWADGLAHCLGAIFKDQAQSKTIKPARSEATLLWIVNSHHDVVLFKLPAVAGGRRWELVVDTNMPRHEQAATFEFDHQYEVTGRSLLLFTLQRPHESSGA
jgi:glycogen operon protein